MIFTREDEDLPVWVADLSNGKQVYQSEKHGSNWTNLRKYVTENNIYIHNIGLVFRDHYEWLIPAKQGYYLSKSILGIWGAHELNLQTDGSLSTTISGFRIGYYTGTHWKLYAYRIPELIIYDQEDCTQVIEDFVIWQPNMNPNMVADS